MRTRPRADPRLSSALEDAETQRDRCIALEEEIDRRDATIVRLEDRLRGQEIKIRKLVQQINVERTRGR